MSKLLALVLLVGGVVLMALGYSDMDSLSSDLVRFFTRSPTDQAVWTLLGGSVASSAGVALWWRSWKGV